MPLFEAATAVDEKFVRNVVATHWSLNLLTLIKASQNHTFKAENDHGDLFAVRVTPDPHNRLQSKIIDELTFLQFVGSQVPGVCLPRPVVSDGDTAHLVRVDNLIFVVFSWAPGKLTDFMNFAWIHDRAMIAAWGSWMGKFHNASRKFSDKFSPIVERMQSWEDIHDGIMRGYQLDDADKTQRLSLIHGDLNISNFHFDADTGNFHAFDFDQVKRGWFELDIAQACMTVFMLKEAGVPVAGTPVSEADKPEDFLHCFVDAYDAAADVPADRARLDRMLAMTRAFCGRFARRALSQERDTVPAGMDAFLVYLDNWVTASSRPTAC